MKYIPTLRIPILMDPNLDKKQDLASQIVGAYEDLADALAVKENLEGIVVENPNDEQVGGNGERMIGYALYSSGTYTHKAVHYAALSQSRPVLRFRRVSTLEKELESLRFLLSVIGYTSGDSSSNLPGS